MPTPTFSEVLIAGNGAAGNSIDMQGGNIQMTGGNIAAAGGQISLGQNPISFAPGILALGPCSTADLPVTGNQGSLIFDEDCGAAVIFGLNNTWEAASIATKNGQPADPIQGQIYFDTGTNHFFGWNGTSWAQLD